MKAAAESLGMHCAEVIRLKAKGLACKETFLTCVTEWCHLHQVTDASADGVSPCITWQGPCDSRTLHLGQALHQGTCFSLKPQISIWSGACDPQHAMW